MWRQLLAVSIGGFVGTGARLGIDALLPHATPGSLAWSTVIVNVVGSFVLGLLVATLWRRPAFPLWARAGLGAGLLGSFTTFSAMAVNSVAGAIDFNLITAVGAIAASMILGLVAAWLGLVMGGVRRNPALTPDEGDSIS